MDYAFTDTRRKREKIIINPKNIKLNAEPLDVKTLDSIFKVSDDNTFGKSELIFNFDIKTKTNKSTSKTSSTCSSRSSNTSSESNEDLSEDESEQEDEAEEDYNGNTSDSDNDSEFFIFIGGRFFRRDYQKLPCSSNLSRRA